MSYSSPLAKVDFSRQVDVYKLAMRGVPDMRRLWNDFASAAPAQARLVIADVAASDAECAKVTKGIDKRLRKAESGKVTKTAKPKLSKREKSAVMASRPLTTDQLVDSELFRVIQMSSDPFEREAAREALRRKGVLP